MMSWMICIVIFALTGHKFFNELERSAKEELECIQLKEKAEFLNIVCENHAPISITQILEKIRLFLFALSVKIFGSYFGGYGRADGAIKLFYILVLFQTLTTLILS